MNRFLPERSDINPRWFHAWGESFGSSSLAIDMSNNDRIFARVRDRMFQAMGIDINAPLNEYDVLVAHAYATDKVRLARLCGMVFHGELLRNRISKSDFETISKIFDIDDLKLMASLRDLHAEDQTFQADMSKLSMLIERTGAACISSWKAGLDEQMGMRIHLMEADDEIEPEENTIVGTDIAKHIIMAVSQALLEEDASLAA